MNTILATLAASWPLIAVGLGIAGSIALVIAKKTKTKADDEVVQTVIEVIDQLPGVDIKKPGQ